MGWLVPGRETNFFSSQETFGYLIDLFKQELNTDPYTITKL